MLLPHKLLSQQRLYLHLLTGLLQYLVVRGPLLLMLVGLSVEIGVHGAGGLKVDELRRSEAGSSHRRSVL